MQLLGLKEGEFIPGHSKMFLKAREGRYSSSARVSGARVGRVAP